MGAQQSGKKMGFDITRVTCAHWLLVLAAAALSACGGGSSGGGGAAAPAACAATSQKQFVLDVMQDIYLYNEQMPVVDLDSFATAESLLEALLVDPPDRFSFIGSAAADDAFFGAGQFVGLGFGTRLVAADELRLTDVFAGSPAAAAGLERGYGILAIDGRSIAEITAAEGVDAAFGPDEVGHVVQLSVADPGGGESDISVTKAVVTIPPVPIETVFAIGGRPVGYLFFRTFVEPSFAALDEAFARFADAGVRDIVLDMRYNGGGLVAVADFLGNLLGGLNANGQVFSMTVFNANNAFRNTTTLLMNETHSLSLDRLVFITTGATASASEIVINSLGPHVTTFVVGSSTFGKPVGSLGFTFCDKILRPTSFETVNAASEGGYFDGLPADCAAADDLDFALGDPAEPSLAEALFVVANDRCSDAETVMTAKQRVAAERDPWRRLVNAR